MTPTPHRRALVRVSGTEAGYLTEYQDGTYAFEYLSDYAGPVVSLTMPIRSAPYLFQNFPPFFDGLLPEGWLLDALLRRTKIDRSDYMGQLLTVGSDLFGAVTVEPVQEERNG